MTKVKDIIDIIEKAAPPALAQEWDNSGLAVGNVCSEVRRVLVTLDVDMKVVNEAVEKKCDMIVSHHPLIFSPLSFVTDENETGAVVLKAAENHIAIFSAHTNLDCTSGGTNDFLCELLGLENVRICEDIAEGNLVRVGEIPGTKFAELAKEIALKFGKKYIRCVGDKEKIIKKVGICSGGGGDYISRMVEKCDLYITGDVKYHGARAAEESGLCLAVAEHFETEHFAKDIFCKILENSGVQVMPSEANRDVMFDLFV